MCTVSYVGDQFGKSIPDRYPWTKPYIAPNNPIVWPPPGPTQDEFDALKKEVEAIKKLLEAAKEYDEVTGQLDCEMDEKVQILKRLAELVEVDLESVFGS